MRKGGKSRSCHRSSPLNIRTNLSLFTRVKGMLRFDRSGSPSSLPATGPPWCLSACQEPVPQLSECPSLSWLARRPCWVWRGPENRATNERPQRRGEEKNPGEMHQNSAESKTLAMDWGLAKKWNSPVQGQSSEDILKLETEINSSFLSAWQLHLVGA